MTASAPHVLYIAWGFPPCRGSGVYRALATANAFAANGWKVTVLTADREIWLRYTGADLSLEERIDPRVNVERVRFEWPTLDPDISSWSRLRVATPRVWGRVRRLRDQLPFPEVAYGPWLPVLKEAVQRIHEQDPVDLTVATANPHVTFGAAHHLWRTAGVDYVMDYRDAWTLDVFSGDRVHSPRSRAGRREAELIGAAKEVWFVNDRIRDWHRTQYPGQADRMHTVANGYDPEFVPPGIGRAPDPDRPLRYGYLGTISTRVPIGEFAEGWRQARRAEPLADATAVIRGHLGHYRAANANVSAMLDSAQEIGITYDGPVAKADVADFYHSVDVLLLILGSGRYVTSGKVFEYAATGLPIVSVHDPDSAASTVLADYPSWFPAASLSAADIAAALLAAGRARRAETAEARDAAVAAAQKFARDAQLRPRVDALRPKAPTSSAPTS